MGITDELRKWGYGFCGSSYEVVNAIADRIDAEHERVRAESFIDMTDENMAEHGWVRLPKDADGEYIHIGDEMEGVDKYDTLKEVKGKVITVSFESNGTTDVAIQVWNSDGKSWHRAYLDPYASVYRHHHAPTVEDVLTKFGIDWEYEDNCEDRAALLAEYAAKLRLADDRKEQ